MLLAFTCNPTQSGDSIKILEIYYEIANGNANLTLIFYWRSGTNYASYKILIGVNIGKSDNPSSSFDHLVPKYQYWYDAVTLKDAVILLTMPWYKRCRDIDDVVILMMPWRIWWLLKYLWLVRIVFSISFVDAS